MNAGQVRAVFDLGDPAHGRVTAGVKRACVEVNRLLTLKGGGNLEAEPGSAGIDRNTGMDVVGIGQPERDLAVAFEALLFSTCGNLLVQVDPLFAPGKPFHERMEIEGLLKKSAPQIGRAHV